MPSSVASANACSNAFYLAIALPLQLSIIGHLLRLYLIKPVDAEALRGTVR